MPRSRVATPEVTVTDEVTETVADTTTMAEIVISEKDREMRAYFALRDAVRTLKRSYLEGVQQGVPGDIVIRMTR